MVKTLQMITPMMNTSKGCELTSANSCRRTHAVGFLMVRIAFERIAPDIACTHCCWPAVIVADPSDSCLIRVKLSTIAPTKRLSETNAPKAGNTMRCGVWEKVPT